MVDSTFNKFGKKLPPVKTGQRFGDEATKNKKVGLFSERRFLIFTKKGPFEITFKPIHYTLRALHGCISGRFRRHLSRCGRHEDYYHALIRVIPVGGRIQI